MKGAVALLVGVVLLACGRATVFSPPARTGEWSEAASLARPRAYATVVALNTGKILVFGGFDQNDPRLTNPTSELIDPATREVTTLPDRIPGRMHLMATSLPDGRVVAAGGVAWNGQRFDSTDRVDVFVPDEGRWTRAAPLLTARSDHGAVALPDGKVLVTGGNLNVHLLASSEIYDPVLDMWRSAAPLLQPRIRFSMAALPDGRVLVAGGLDRTGHPLASSEIYDPRRDTWTAGPEMSDARVQHATVVLPGGDVLLIGGLGSASGTAERYDHLTSAFVYAGSLVTPRLIEQAAVLPDGRVLITGGSPQRPGYAAWSPFPDAEVWDPRTGLWTAFPSPKLPRAWGQLVTTTWGLYLIGGFGTDEAAHREIERLTLK